MTTRERPILLPMLIVGGIFVFVGGFYLLTNTFGLDLEWDQAWPLALVLVGAAIVFFAARGTRGEPG